MALDKYGLAEYSSLELTQSDAIAGTDRVPSIDPSTGNVTYVLMSDLATYCASGGIGPFTVTSTSASALTVGANGATNPVLKVDANTASVATGVKITGAAAAGGVSLAAISSGTDESLKLDAKGAGVVVIGSVSTGGISAGSNSTDRVVMKGIYMSPANVSVTIPSYAADTCDSVSVDVSAAFSIQPAVGDAVIAIPQEALPSNCVVTNAYVTATDTITVTFASAEGASVTGAAKNFKFLVIDLT